MKKMIRIWVTIIVIMFSQNILVSAMAEPAIFVFGKPTFYLNSDSVEPIDWGCYDVGSYIWESADNTSDITGDENAVSSEYAGGEETSDSDNGVMYVSGSPFARLRSDESTNNPYLAKMPFGSQVTYISSNTVEGVLWSYIIYNEQYGYCMSKYLTTNNPYEGIIPHPITIDATFGSNVLQRGNHYPDAHVKNLQLCLIEGGYLSGEPGADGLFGSATEKALAKYQKARGLEPVGYAGKTTKARLWNEFSVFLGENGVIQ